MRSGDSWEEWGKHVISTLEALSESMKKLNEIQMTQNETLLRNTITVEEHHKRSVMLEEQINKLESKVKSKMEVIDKDMIPLKEHVQQVSGVGKTIRWVGYISGSILSVSGLVKLLELIGK